MQSSRPSDRQLAIFVSVAVGIVVAVVTTATFWWIYDLTLGRERAAAAELIGAPWSPSEGIKAITAAAPVATDARGVYYGTEAWAAGVQAGQAWVQQYPNTVNVQVLTGMSSAQVWTYMQQYVSGGLGVGCQYCHNLQNFASDEYPQKVSARNMLRLVNDLNREFVTGLPNWRGNYVQCATCHNNQPNNLEAFGVQFVNSVPPIHVTVDPLDANGQPILDPAQKPALLQEQVDLKDAVLYYIYNYQVWKPYDPADPESGRGSLALTYDGGRTQDQVTINQNVMNYQSWSLGVGCTFCHNSRNFTAYETNPAGDNVLNPVYAYNKLKAQRMLQMTTWLAANWTQYGAVPKVELPTGDGAASELSYQVLGDGQLYNIPSCYTCHRGNSVPLASVNQSQIPAGDAGLVVLPQALRGDK